MSDLDLAVTRSKRLERLLEEKLGATGKGLHQKAGSVEARLPPDLLRRIRIVATVRNKVVHEDDYRKIQDRAGFLRACDEAERGLEALGGQPRGRGRWFLIAALLLLALAAVIVWRVVARL